MRVSELLFKEEIDDTLSTSLKQVLDHLVHQYNDSTSAGDNRISWQTIIQMMPEDVPRLDYDGFKQMYDMEPDWKHLVQSFDDEFITLNTGEEVDVNMGDPENIEEPSLNTVDDMAKRAMKKRI
jgi:hypothetical protein